MLEETNVFLESSVLSDYKEFEEVGNQYREDAESFKGSMVRVNEGIVHLADVIEISIMVLDSTLILSTALDPSMAASALAFTLSYISTGTICVPAIQPPVRNWRQEWRRQPQPQPISMRM